MKHCVWEVVTLGEGSKDGQVNHKYDPFRDLFPRYLSSLNIQTDILMPNTFRAALLLVLNLSLITLALAQSNSLVSTPMRSAAADDAAE